MLWPSRAVRLAFTTHAVSILDVLRNGSPCRLVSTVSAIRNGLRRDSQDGPSRRRERPWKSDFSRENGPGKRVTAKPDHKVNKIRVSKDGPFRPRSNYATPSENPPSFQARDHRPSSRVSKDGPFRPRSKYATPSENPPSFQARDHRPSSRNTERTASLEGRSRSRDGQIKESSEQPRWASAAKSPFSRRSPAKEKSPLAATYSSERNDQRPSQKTFSYNDRKDAQIHQRAHREEVHDAHKHNRPAEWDNMSRSPSTKPPRPPKPPVTIPYTTAASEFLYGTSVVTAALKAEGRKLYNLYIYQGENRTVRTEDETIGKLGLARGVKVKKLDSLDWLSAMDRMSAGRPHNGYLLEASPLSRRPITCLGPIQMDEGSFEMNLDHQTREEENVNGIHRSINYSPQGRRHPFVLMLDGILDTGNLGAIMRSAYFLGADAVVMSSHNAPLGSVALKASAGAIENLPIVTIQQTGAFINDSQQNGWKFYAAIAPPSHPKGISASGQIVDKHFSARTLGAPLVEHPCVLMLGSEGTGLRRDLQRKADYTLSIEGKRSGTGGVDSLNVSVAAALLCDAFLNDSTSRTPKSADTLF